MRRTSRRQAARKIIDHRRSTPHSADIDPRSRSRISGALVLTALFVAGLWTAAGAAAAPPFDEGGKNAALQAASQDERLFLVDVGSRLIAPGLANPIDFRGARAEVYLQFDGPLRASERGLVKRMGVRIYAAVSPNTYLAKIKSSSVDRLRNHPRIRGIEMVEAADKLTRSLYEGDVPSHVVNANGSWAVTVRFYEDTKLAQALDAVDALGVEVLGRSELLVSQRLRVNATHEQILALSDDSRVRSIAPIVPPPENHNSASQTLHNVDDIQAAPFSLDGDGVLVGQWESGNPLGTHADLTPRVTVVQAGAGVTDHGTHVAGTIMSTGNGNANAEGMGPSVDAIFSYDFGGDVATEQTNAVANNAIDLSNHSWGATLGWSQGANTGNSNLFGAYDTRSSNWDNMVQNTGLIVMKSSGNDSNNCDPNPPNLCDGIVGGDGNQYDNIGPRGSAKNVITVGALTDAGGITTFSSNGPTDDGRIKPDVTANGTALTSTWAGGVTNNICGLGTNYCAIGGTSMAAPTVTGTVSLLVERYRDNFGGATPSPDIVKALLVNTAVDIGRPGPDYLFGHGQLDALAAVNTIDAGAVRILTDAVDDGDVDEYLIGVPAGTTNLQLALNWIDPEGVANNASADLVNDLDVEAVAPDGTIFFPFSGPGTGAGNVANNATATGANTADTVESLRTAAPQQGFWTVRVRGSSVPDGPQNYALVSNVSFSLDDQPDIRVNAPLDFDEICEGDFQDIPITIFNVGGANLLVDSVSVTAGGPNFSVLPNPTQPFIVAPGAHVDLTVRFSPTSPGFKAGTLEIVSNDADEGTIELSMTGEGGVGDINATLEADGEFGDVALGSFRLLTLQILNQGTCNLQLTNVGRISGSADFSVGEIPGAGLPAFPIVLSPDAHVDIPLRFEPSAFGPQTATFEVESDDPDTPLIEFDVTGDSPPSDIRVSGSTEFGEQCEEDLGEKIVDLCNVGLSDLVVSSVAFNPPCADFTLINNPFPAPVSHDFCLPLTIAYTPTAAGSHSCTLQIVSNDPDSSVVNLSVTGSTPLASIDVPPDRAFRPTVVQSVDVCEKTSPFPVSNTGQCDLEITALGISTNAAEYSISGLPSFSIFLDSGHIVGDGDLNLVFAPEVVDRERHGTVSVTWVHDPITGVTMSTSRDLCGEGVYTGARVLVTEAGVPLDTVKSIRLHRINANRNKMRLNTVDTARNLDLQTITPTAPCTPFLYHREYGTVSNPVQLLPGSYEITVQTPVAGRMRKRTVGFDVNSCGFNPTVIVDF